MAIKEAPPPPPTPAPAGPAKKRGKLLIMIGAAVLLVLGVGTAAILLLVPPPDDEEISADEKPKKKKRDEKPLLPAYLSMEPFVVNLTSESGDQYLQVAMTFEFAEGKEADLAKVFTPKIRNQVMLLLSGKKPAELAPKEGKEKLAAEIRDEVNGVLAAHAEHSDAKGGGKGSLKAVLFTSFIIQ
jgi:flagellar protein FliL